MITLLNNLNKTNFSTGRIDKGWGYEILHQNTPYIVKTLNYYDDCYSSGHLHTKKDETFVVISGKFELTRIDCLGKKYPTILHPNDLIYLKHGTYHQIYCFEEGTILEMSTSIEEDDTVIIDSGMSQVGGKDEIL